MTALSSNHSNYDTSKGAKVYVGRSSSVFQPWPPKLHGLNRLVSTVTLMQRSPNQNVILTQMFLNLTKAASDQL